MKHRKSKKVDKILSPIDLHSRIVVWHDINNGKSIHANAPRPLEPSELTRVQQIELIEYLKYCNALSNREIADFLKMHRITVAKRLEDIQEKQALELQGKGLNVWELIHRLKMTVEYVKKQARIKEDPDLFLRAEVTFINQCQKLGVIFEKPREINLHQFTIKSEEEERRIFKIFDAEIRSIDAEVKELEKSINRKNLANLSRKSNN